MTRLHHRHMVKRHPFKKLGIWILRIIPILAVIIFIWAQTNLVLTKQYIYTAIGLPKSFVGYKIMHVSDIANSDNNVVSIAKNEKPDIIIMTGGYSDDDGDANHTIKTVNKLAEVAHVYYIYSLDDEQHVLDSTNATNITNISIELQPKQLDESSFIRNNYGEEIIKQYNKEDEEAVKYVNYIIDALEQTKNSTIILCGLDLYNGENTNSEKLAARNETFELIGTDEEKITMMLNGNAGLVDEICTYTNTDMIFMGGSLGTNRVSDKYVKGLYGNSGTEVFVSGGVGTREGYMRIMNLPEVQVITLSDGTLTYKTPLEKLIARFIPDVGTIFDNDGGFQSYTYEYDNESLQEEKNSKSGTKSNSMLK